MHLRRRQPLSCPAAPTWCAAASTPLTCPAARTLCRRPHPQPAPPRPNLRRRPPLIPDTLPYHTSILLWNMDMAGGRDAPLRGQPRYAASSTAGAGTSAETATAARAAARAVARAAVCTAGAGAGYSPSRKPSHEREASREEADVVAGFTGRPQRRRRKLSRPGRRSACASRCGQWASSWSGGAGGLAIPSPTDTSTDHTHIDVTRFHRCKWSSRRARRS